MKQSVTEYLKQDRQWPRHLRVAHANYQKRNTGDDEAKKFWSNIIAANADAPIKKGKAK